MPTITIQDVPEDVAKRIGTHVCFSQIQIRRKRMTKDPTIKINVLVNDPKNTNYGPFTTAEEAIDFLDRDICK